MQYLFHIFIAPWKQKLREKAATKRIVIVPIEEICLVPLAALVDSEDGEFLIQKYKISTVSSLRMFKHCELRRQQLKQTGKKCRALLVGNPEENLPAAEEEAQKVTNILKDAGLEPILLMRNAATRHPYELCCS